MEILKKLAISGSIPIWYPLLQFYHQKYQKNVFLPYYLKDIQPLIYQIERDENHPYLEKPQVRSTQLPPNYWADILRYHLARIIFYNNLCIKSSEFIQVFLPMKWNAVRVVPFLWNDLALNPLVLDSRLLLILRHLRSCSCAIAMFIGFWSRCFKLVSSFYFLSFIWELQQPAPKLGN
jgi:hypothetical protein